MPSIAKIHEQLLDHLLKLRKTEPDLFFTPRKRDNKGRLSKGYWFLGNDHYAFVNLWYGADWKERVSCIGFVVWPDGTNYIELSGQGAPELVPFLEKVANAESGFTRSGMKNKWFKYFPDKDYIKNFDEFVHRFKPKVDRLIDQEKPSAIRKITVAEFQQYGGRVIALRQQQLNYQKTHKITRLSWNTNNWQYPSGWQGKSLSQSTHEGKHGFGYEEWLFDRSKLIDGFHYGFVKGLETKTNLHAGKTYELYLYSQNSLRKYYYVGCIRKAEVISHEISAEIYDQYQTNGWLHEMAASLERVKAEVTAFRKVDPQLFVNVRFKLMDLDLPDELIEMSEFDDNIIIDRFKLLGYRGEIVPVMNPELPEDTVDLADTGHEGNWKNTGRRRRTFNIDQEFDPYHDKMQNAIVKFLRDTPDCGYVKVDIETSRVDIKALTHDGDWHYFEIKTASPKRNIRDALGQVMEYAYYPGRERAKQLIIVGDRPPEADALNYLAYLRYRFGIPVTYRYFDWDTLMLSNDLL